MIKILDKSNVMPWKQLPRVVAQIEHYMYENRKLLFEATEEIRL